MLKSAKGEMSVGLIIGLVLIVAIIIGLIVWSRSNKTADMNQESANVPVTTNTSTTSTTSGGPNPTTTTTTTTVETTPANPTLPQTGMGPEEK